MSKNIQINKDTAMFGLLKVCVRKNFYDGLWYIKYDYDGSAWSNGYKTRKEARERLAEECAE